MGNHRLRLPAWGILLAVAAALAPVYIVVSGNNYAGSALYFTAALGGTGTIVAAVHLKRRSLGYGWRLFALGFVAYACGDVVWALHDIYGITAASTKLDDGFYLASYPFLIGATFAMPLARRLRLDTVLRQLVDVALLFVSGSCALWFLYGDSIRHESPHNVLAFVYPTLDLLLLAVVARSIFGVARWPASHRLLAASVGLLFGADLGWRLMIAAGTFTPGSSLNGLFIVAYLLATAAAVHPSASAVEGFASGDWAAPNSKPWRRFAILVAATSVPGLLLFFGPNPLDGRLDRAIVGATAILLPLLALTRGYDFIRALRRVAEDADAARHRSDAIINASPIPIVVVDPTGIVRVWNSATERATGLPATDVVGRARPGLLDGDPRSARAIESALRGEPQDRVDLVMHRPNGDRLNLRMSAAPIETGGASEIVALFEDVTPERRHHVELDRLAHHDSLTGLPNRRSFQDELTDAHEHELQSTWVVLLDIDNFKSVNDAGGHRLGDDVLSKVAVLLRHQLRPADFLARLGDDLFATVLYDMPEETAVEICERLLDAVRQFRLETEQQTIDVTVSAGLSLLDPAVGTEATLHRAEEALCEAKRLGKNRVERWNPDLAAVDDSRRWSPIIKDALRGDRLDLYLQPIVPLRGMGPATFEALCRLRLPGGTVVPAQDFIPSAERLGLIVEIDRRMLEQAAELIAADGSMRIFVNLCPASLSSPSLLAWLEETLAELPAQSLGIEITERTALLQPNRAAVVLARLIDAGALVAIDDFGVGFVSFNQLATLPCHIVKIPAELAQGSGIDGIADAITRAVANVAHAYGKQVVIEGIETAEADSRARALRIEYGQGWYYGKPEPSPQPLPPLSVVNAA